MCKKALILFLTLIILLVSAGCTPAQKDVYETYYEYMYIDPETGEFVDPETFVPNIEEDEEDEEDYEDDDEVEDEEKDEEPETEDFDVSDDFQVDLEDKDEEKDEEPEVEESEESEDLDEDSDDEESEDGKSNEPIFVNVADFGAKGDGVTDDAKALYDACMELMKGGPGSKLIFEKGKTYYALNNGGSTKALIFRNLSDNVTVEGNGATILTDGELCYMSVSGCTGLTVSDLNFNRKTTSHFIGTVIGKETYEETKNGKLLPMGYIEVISDRDIGFSDEEYTPTEDGTFAFVADENMCGKRNYMYVQKITTVNASERIYRFYPDLTRKANQQNDLGTTNNFEKLENGSKVIIPTPYVGHYLSDSVFIGGSSDLTFKNIKVHNVPRFGFHINSNLGKITFDNVDLVPHEDEEAVFVSWRDGFHCKGNRGPITWKDCDAVGLGDDIINISSNILYVNTVYAGKDTPLIDGKKYPDQIKCTFPQGNSYGSVSVGDKVSIYDTETGMLIGKTTIKKVVDEYENRYLLSEPLKGLKKGESIKVCFDNHAAPGSQLINCNFEGTLRFRGTATDCKLKLYKMMLYPEGNVEGPIPHDTIFRNCDFTGTSSSGLVVTASPNGETPMEVGHTWKEGRFRLENVGFENCIGLTKSLFYYLDNNLDPNSIDYITITPALTN